ncbi:hypothetical protein GOP47_0019411 [Adiantum capillus-veneris]|uniref:J domain-containing protein n=1 Tax=Adiantum capillus-veneris TaxID=13818 RepID=A0A9D4UB09_ADICA|nr:hypothetical protein GOP47_0019411 [Adiantum capillus-veneris]
MGKVVQCPWRRAEEEEEEGKWAVERASERVARGDMEGALWLLQRAQRLHPAARGLAEIQAVAQVCHAATWNPCACSSASQRASPHWYRILTVNEKADLGTIKKRYRQLALLLHPDKNKHARAEEAFKLVSEAYAHLSDSKKREAFDSLIRKRECRKCSSECQPAWDATRCSTESLKGRNQMDYQSCCFPFDFHTAEWRMEHEKLRMFREQAQAKVDSLAHILKERRSRWSEEMGITKGRYRKASERRMYGNNFQSNAYNEIKDHVEGKAFDSGSLEELYNQCKGATNDESRRETCKISQSSRVGGEEAFVEKRLVQDLGCKSSNDTQTPQVLQKLQGLLGILKEEMSGNGNEDAKLRTERFCGEGRAAEVATMYINAKRAACSSANAPQHSGNKLEEERTVIDDFLAGLNERGVGDQPRQRKYYTGWNFNRPKDTVPNENPKRNGYKASSSFYTESNRARTAQSGLSCSEGLKMASSKEKIMGNCHQAGSNALAADGSHLWQKSESVCGNEEKILERQKKKSEQLLRTLERLREETQSVVATLESMKAEARIFPAASCHVPAPIAT